MKREEWRWLAAMTAIAVLVTSLPTLILMAQASADRPFVALPLLDNDVISYLAKMRHGAMGEWLYQNPYTSLAHVASPIYLIYLLLGHAAALTSDARIGLDRLVAVYQAARMLFSVAMLIILYRLIAEFLEEIRFRRLAWLLIVYGGGLGWLLIVLSGSTLPFSGPPLDLYLAEATMIVPLLILPHTLLARSALYGGIIAMLWADRQGDWKAVGVAGGCWLIATVAIPFDVLVAGAIMGGWLVMRWLSQRRVPIRLGLMAGMAGLPAVFFALGTLAIIKGDRVYAAWQAQNTLPIPSPVHLLSMFGVQIGLAIPAVMLAWRRRMPQVDLLTGWLIASPLLILIPVPYQLRLIESFSVPLGLAVALFFKSLDGWVRKVSLALTVGALAPTTLFLLLGAIGLSVYGRDQVLLRPDLAALLEWLRVHGDRDSVVLSSTEEGVLIPAVAPVLAVLGHPFETPGYAELSATVRDFYSIKMTESQSREFLRKYLVRYILVGPHEMALACPDSNCAAEATIAAGTSLEIVFEQGKYHLYRIIAP
jgi:hypothetical protein